MVILACYWWVTQASECVRAQNLEVSAPTCQHQLSFGTLISAVFSAMTLFANMPLFYSKKFYKHFHKTNPKSIKHKPQNINAIPLVLGGLGLFPLFFWGGEGRGNWLDFLREWSVGLREILGEILIIILIIYCLIIWWVQVRIYANLNKCWNFWEFFYFYKS